MLASGAAYKCFSTQERDRGLPRGRAGRGPLDPLPSPWRDVPEAEHPDAPFAIRVKAPREGETVIDDGCRAT